MIYALAIRAILLWNNHALHIHLRYVNGNSKQNFNAIFIIPLIIVERIFRKGLNRLLIVIRIKVSMKWAGKKRSKRFETISSKLQAGRLCSDAMTNFYKARSAAQSFTIC